MSILVGLASQPIPPIDLTLGQAVAAEADGFDSIWYPDHLMGWFPKSLWTPENSSIATILPSPHLYLDPIAVMAVVGRSTQKILIGTGVTDPIRRPPAELARTFVTLSQMTAGRAILGIGAGERENVVPYGLDYRYQVSRLEESLYVIRLLWESTGPVSFQGRFFKLDRAVLDLKGFDGLNPPIWVGAHGPRMLEITGQYGDGWYPSYPMTPVEYASKLKTIRKAATDAGRDPAAITAGYQMYVVLAPDHETSHAIMSSPLAAGMALVAPSRQWEKAGFRHPFGSGFEGLRDYVPEWYTPQEIKEAVAQFDIAVVHDDIVHGSVDEVVKAIEPLIDAGLQHVTLSNLAPIAGLEHLTFAQEAIREVARTLRS